MREPLLRGEEKAENPLLDERGLPRFDEIESEQIEPGMRALLVELERELDALEREVLPSWAGAVEPLERISDRLGTRWGIVGHLLGVKNGTALRAAHEAVQPEVVRFGIRLAQSRPLYEAFVALQKSAAAASLDPAQRRVVEVLVRDAVLSGVALEGAQKERFNAILTELAELQTTFSNHVLDATKACHSCCASETRLRAYRRALSTRLRSPRAKRVTPTRHQSSARGGSRSTSPRSCPRSSTFGVAICASRCTAHTSRARAPATPTTRR